jgi:hypothetical protein
MMKVVDPGRSYELAAGNGLVFLRKQEGRIVRDGTTNEEVLEVLIDRVTEAYQTLPCQESIRALYLLREALEAFRTRAARRMHANVEGTLQPHDPVAEAPDILQGKSVAREFDALDQSPN